MYSKQKRVFLCNVLISFLLLCFFHCDNKDTATSPNNEPLIVWAPYPESRTYEYDAWGRKDCINDENGDIFVDYLYSGQQLIGYLQYIRFYNTGHAGEIDITATITGNNTTIQESAYQISVECGRQYTLLVEGNAGPLWEMSPCTLSVSCPNAVETDSTHETWTGESNHMYRTISRVFEEGNESEGIVPNLYDGIPPSYYQPVYCEYFFSNDQDWLTGTGSNYSASINSEAGYYEIINFSSDHKYIFWELVSDLDENKNFQIETNIKNISTNDEDGGNGLVWGGESNGELRYYRFYINHDSFSVLDDQGEDHEYWIDWTNSGSVNEPGTCNKLTVRKYDGQYYFFINEVYVGQHVFKSLYGNYTGFRVYCETTIQVDNLIINHLEFDS